MGGELACARNAELVYARRIRGVQLSTEHRNRLTRARLVLAGFGWRVFLRRYRRPLLAVLLLACLAGALVAVVVVATSGSSSSTPTPPVQASAATLAAVPTNHVTGSGTATVQLRGDTATVTLDTTGLLNGSPHLAHIHGEGLGTCPTAVNARLHNGHRSISTGDAIRLYGSTLTSFTAVGKHQRGRTDQLRSESLSRERKYPLQAHDNRVAVGSRPDSRPRRGDRRTRHRLQLQPHLRLRSSRRE